MSIHVCRLGSIDMDRILALTRLPAVLLSSSFSILKASENYLALYNLSAEECVGCNIYSLAQARGLMPQEALLRFAVNSVITTSDIHVSRDIAAADGSYWNLRAIPVRKEGQLLSVMLEVQNATEERFKGQELDDRLSTDETYRILVETVKDYAIFMLDTQGYIATWNTGAALLKGYKREEIIGRHFSVFYSDQDRIAETPRKELEVCLQVGKFEDEGWRYRKDSSRFWANVIITAVYREGVHIGFSKVTRDLTERKAAEAGLISACEESAKLKSEFLANMSHEIRTPLHGMLSALSLLLESQLNPEQRELGSIMEESGSTLLQVINDILDYSRLSSGYFSISFDVVGIPDIIASIVHGFTTAIHPSAGIESSIDPRVPKSGYGDPLRYRQIVQNLVANAVKFTDVGSVHIHASVTREDVASYTILTEVIDTGIGVPDSIVDSLFTPFTQFDNSATKRHKGTGLGLSICKGLAELMGGTVGFRPNPGGQGSIFWFTIKLGKQDRPNQRHESERKRLKLTPPLRPCDPLADVKVIAVGKRLLLAEDNAINRKVMLKMLKGFGFEKVDTASDGGETAQLVRKNPRTYDLILMDISMPVLDGIGATMEIRQAGLDVPIVALTANALKGDAEACLAKGMNDYIPKPVDRQLLLKVLLKWLKG